MKKIILTLLLGLNSFAFASKPAPVSPSVAEVSDTKIISSQNFFVTKSYDENNIPQDLKKWVPWVNKDNYTQNCVDSICIFIPKLTVLKNNHYKFIFEGTSLSKDAWVPLPSSDNAWPLSVVLNGQKSIVVNHEGKPFVQVPQKDFKIEVDYNLSIFDKDSSFELPFNVVSFDNQSNQVLSLKDNTLSLNDINSAQEQNSFQEIKVFRKFTDNIPYQLETNVQLNFSGKIKEIDLGTVLPPDFKLTQINSDLKVNFKNNHYFVTILPGTHFINFKSFANKEISQLSVKGLFNDIDSEVWSIQKNNAIRNIDIAQATLVDPKQANVPQQWSNLPSYLVSDNLEIHTSQQGLSLNTDLRVNARRTSVFGYNDTVYSLDQISLENQNSKELRFNSGVPISSLSLSQQKMILTENNQNYVLLNSNDKSGYLQFDTTKGNPIQSQLSESYFVDTWRASFTPRTELLWTTNAKITSSNFWFNAWNLYSLFSLSVLIIALYKLMGKEAAFFALFSLVSFYYNNSVFWIFWILLVLSYAFNKYLPAKYANFKKNTNTINLVGTILVIFFVLQFVFNEIFSIMHPNVSHRLYISPISSLITIFILFIAYKLVNKIVAHKATTGKKKGGWLIWLVLAMIFLTLPYIFSISLSTTVGSRATSSGILSGNLNQLDDNVAMPAAPAPMEIQNSAQVEMVAENIKAIDGASNNPEYIEKANSLEDIARRQEENQKEAFNQSRMLAKSKTNIVRNIAQEKVQVGHATMEANLRNVYDLKPSNQAPVEFYVANKWFVNLYGILQSLFLIFLAYILIIYNLFVFKREDLLHKLPSSLQKNVLTRKIQSKINEA